MADPNPKGLTVDMMEREEARIFAQRERNEARRHRFLNARVRTIGVSGCQFAMVRYCALLPDVRVCILRFLPNR